jgi:hypothetical protein
MHYATATYGFAAIEAANDQKQAIKEPEKPEEEEPEQVKLFMAQSDVMEEEPIPERELERIYRVKGRFAKKTRKNICEHIGIEEDDMLAMFVKAGGNMYVLRHFLAVDKKKKAIVLAIRGTFSVSELLIDAELSGGTLLLVRRAIWWGRPVTDASSTRVIVFDSVSKPSPHFAIFVDIVIS